MRKIKLLFLLFLLILTILTYRPWFILKPLAGGDYITFWRENFENGFNPFSSWEEQLALGWYRVVLLHYDPYNLLVGAIGALLDYNTVIIERLFWFFPFLLFSVFSSVYLFKNLFPKNSFWPIAPLIFLFNTYVLMIAAGGQVGGVGLAYSLAPLVLGKFISVINGSTGLRADNKRLLSSQNLLIKNSLIYALILALSVMFDLRIAYIALIAGGVYFLSNGLTVWQVESKKLAKRQNFFIRNSLIYGFLIPGIIVLGLHMYWLLPMVLTGFSPQKALSAFGEAYTTAEAVKFFSFAKFENSLSLLHPNWPENIFGKTYFMRPEFLLLPILAFTSLLFLNKPIAQLLNCSIAQNGPQKQLTMKQCNNKTIIFFSLLGLIGAFLAKGSNPPFGEIYAWLFKYFPGMIMFRDPTKFYVLVALSYSVLIPFSIANIYRWINEKLKIKNEKQQFKIQKFLPDLFLLFTIFYLLFLTRPAILGQLGGTFKPREVPQEYVALKDFLVSQPEFFRTLWVPQKQRFGFYSNNHPAISAQEIFATSELSFLVEKLKDQETKELLQRAGVKYLIIPYDSEGEIFLKDRKYDYRQRLALEEELDEIPWLKKITSPWFNDVNHFSKITVYQTPEFRDHFWLEDSTVLHRTVEWRMVNPTKYIVQIKNLAKPATLVFSETYDSGWQAKTEGETISSKPFNKVFNSFLIKKTGDFEVVVEFAPQKYVNYGLIISILTLTLLIVILKNTLRKKHVFSQ